MKEIFVFGSNTEGRHGKGDALEARLHHGAVYGQSRGLQGNAWAIITKDLSKGKRSIPLDYIKAQVLELIAFACIHPQEDYKFLVSPIGCGLAGYTPEEIAPFFEKSPPNVILPDVFKRVLHNLNNKTDEKA